MKLNNKQQEKILKLNEELLTKNKGLLCESIKIRQEKVGLFDKNLQNMKRLIKPLNESFMRDFSHNKNNVKIAEYNFNGDQSQIIFFILPDDEQFIEQKNGRELNFTLSDFQDFIEDENDSDDFMTSDPNDPEGVKYFDFDSYWGQMNAVKRNDDLKSFVIFKIKENGSLPELK